MMAGDSRLEAVAHPLRTLRREMSWLEGAISTAVSTGLTVGVEEEFLLDGRASGYGSWRIVQGACAHGTRRACPRPGSRTVDVQVAAAAMWSAARYGLTRAVVDPMRGCLLPARQRLAELLAHVHPALADNSDLGTVVRLLGRLWRDGTGAQRQRAAASAHGILAAVRQLSVQAAGNA